MSEDTPFNAPSDLLPKISSNILRKLSDGAFPKLPNCAVAKLTDYAFPKIPDYAFPKIPDYAFLKIPESIASIVEIGQRMAEAFAPYADIHRHMADVIGPLAKQIDGFRLPPTLLPQIENSARLFIEAQEHIAQSLRGFVEGLAPGLRSISELIKNLAAIERKAQLLKGAGFLPHVTTPMYLVDDCADDSSELSNSIEKHYRDHWQEIEAELSTRVDAHISCAPRHAGRNAPPQRPLLSLIL